VGGVFWASSLRACMVLPQASEPAWYYLKPQRLHGITSSLRACMALPKASEPAWHYLKPQSLHGTKKSPIKGLYFML